MKLDDRLTEEFFTHYRNWLQAKKNLVATRLEDQKDERLLTYPTADHGVMAHVRTHSSDREINVQLKRLERRLRGKK